MKNMPNIPATVSTWTMFAPLTFRERKIRRGINGVPAVASRAMNSASRTSEPAPSSSVSVAPQPCSAAGFTIVYTPSISDVVIRNAPSRSAPWPKPRPSSSSSRRIVATAVTTPIGALMKKIQCQLMICVITPPSSRPTAPPAEATNA